MKNSHQSVDKMYSLLGINNQGMIPRREINVGTMSRRLQTNNTLFVENSNKMNWSNSTKQFKI